jgi:glycosyltransferase involved in cell wall biosynthesis
MAGAAQVTTPSFFLKDLIGRSVGDYDIRVVPNGIDVNRFKPLVKEPILLLVGRLLSFKGFQHVLTALEGVESDFEVHIAGDGPMMPELRAIAARLKVKVVFHGWLDSHSDELCSLYGRASIFAMPSAAESFGLVFAEAMCAGCAVLGANAGAIPDVVEDGVTGLLVPPGDVPATRQALTRLMQEVELRTRLADAGRKRALNAYAWSVVGGQYICLYENIAGRGPGRRWLSRLMTL